MVARRRGPTGSWRCLPQRPRVGCVVLSALCDRERARAEGEFQAAERLKDAALVIADHPIALQLRYLQTLLEIGDTNSTTIVFPAPIELMRPFLAGSGGRGANDGERG